MTPAERDGTSQNVAFARKTLREEDQVGRDAIDSLLIRNVGTDVIRQGFEG